MLKMNGRMNYFLGKNTFLGRGEEEKMEPARGFQPPTYGTGISRSFWGPFGFGYVAAQDMDRF